MDADMPWSDCKVAFDCDNEDKLWTAHSAGRLTLPPGWSLDGTDGSGARSVVLFRVDGAVWPQDGNFVLATLRRIGAVAKRTPGVIGKDKPCPHCDAPPGHWHSFSCPVREQPAPGVPGPDGSKR